jgi:hypothetical protein
MRLKRQEEEKKRLADIKENKTRQFMFHLSATFEIQRYTFGQLIFLALPLNARRASVSSLKFIKQPPAGPPPGMEVNSGDGGDDTDISSPTSRYSLLLTYDSFNVFITYNLFFSVSRRKRAAFGKQRRNTVMVVSSGSSSLGFERFLPHFLQLVEFLSCISHGTMHSFSCSDLA